MFILFCYLIAILPLAIAAGLWYFSKRVTWWEALSLSVLSALIVLCFHVIAVNGMLSDTETWSGVVTESQFRPTWKEYYEYAVYRTEYYYTTETERYTDSKGKSHTRTVRVKHSKQVFDHWEPTTRTHSDKWSCNDTVNGGYDIDQSRYKDILNSFGQEKSKPGTRRTSEHKSRMISGDPNDYYTVNVKNYIYPVTSRRSFENRVKAAPSVFSYAKVPENAPVFEYPSNNDKFCSDRTVGAVGVSTLNLDQMNAILGPTKQINVILAGFGVEKGSDIAQLQEAKWFGGKKNDLVICFGGGQITKPSWVYVFGWSESDICKQNLQSIIMQNGMKNETLPLIQKEIMTNYKRKDWHKFDYLTIEVPASKYIWLFAIVALVNIGGIIFAMKNDVDKEGREERLFER